MTEAPRSISVTNWIRSFYGPGKMFPSARQLSLEISDNRNQNAVSEIETRGLVTMEKLRGAAKATRTNPVRLMLIAGWLTDEEIREYTGVEPKSIDEAQALNLAHDLPDRYRLAWLEFGAKLLELAQVR